MNNIMHKAGQEMLLLIKRSYLNIYFPELRTIVALQRA